MDGVGAGLWDSSCDNADIKVRHLPADRRSRTCHVIAPQDGDWGGLSALARFLVTAVQNRQAWLILSDAAPLSWNSAQF